MKARILVSKWRPREGKALSKLTQHVNGRARERIQPPGLFPFLPHVSLLPQPAREELFSEACCKGMDACFIEWVINGNTGSTARA